jgi:hypothetical protein
VLLISGPFSVIDYLYPDMVSVSRIESRSADPDCSGTGQREEQLIQTVADLTCLINIFSNIYIKEKLPNFLKEFLIYISNCLDMYRVLILLAFDIHRPIEFLDSHLHTNCVFSAFIL